MAAEDTVVMMIGNKTDKQEMRQVPYLEAQEVSLNYNANSFYNQIFLYLIFLPVSLVFHSRVWVLYTGHIKERDGFIKNEYGIAPGLSAFLSLLLY